MMTVYGCIRGPINARVGEGLCKLKENSGRRNIGYKPRLGVTRVRIWNSLPAEVLRVGTRVYDVVAKVIGVRGVSLRPLFLCFSLPFLI